MFTACWEGTCAAETEVKHDSLKQLGEGAGTFSTSPVILLVFVPPTLTLKPCAMAVQSTSEGEMVEHCTSTARGKATGNHQLVFGRDLFPQEDAIHGLVVRLLVFSSCYSFGTFMGRRVTRSDT
jgi:hypothetical protein